VLDEYRGSVSRSAPITIRPGGSLIGSPVVALSLPSPGDHLASPGDTLLANPSSDFDNLRTQVTTTLGTEVPVVLDNIRILSAQLRAARGTLGALGIEGPDRIGATARAAGALLNKATSGPGTVGLTLSRGDLSARARRVLARVDRVRARAASPTSTVGRVRDDSTLFRTVARVRADLTAVQQALDEPRGTVGRTFHDRALQLELARARAELDAIIQDLQRNPLRYVRP
jgi:phospholipid/cholesterol/gamma-HCH transport system substrate-binding protein